VFEADQPPMGGTMRILPSMMVSLCLVVQVWADDAKKEMERLQGEWEVERAETEGKNIPLDQIKDKLYTLKGEELIPSKNPNDPAKLVLDPSKKPGWIDLIDRDKKTMLGIYRVKDDRWEICLSESEGARPEEFKTTEKSNTYLMVLRRKGK
jgi:uncharacterized protein (TIGR03067 family)